MLAREIVPTWPATKPYRCGTVSDVAKLYLKEWRERAGLTQPAAGDLIGVTHAQIQRWEARKRGVPSARLQSIAQAYGAPGPEALFAPPLGNTGKPLRHPSTREVNAPLTPGGDARSVEETSMTPGEMAIIIEVYDSYPPDVRAGKIRELLRERLSKVTDLEAAETGPRKGRASST